MNITNLKGRFDKSILYNLKYIFISLVLLIITNILDFRIINIIDIFPDLFLMKATSAKSILTTLAGSLLTITTFTFSTILVVINMYASNFSHRVVENFINDNMVMKVLGIFIGGFVYCVLSIVSIDILDRELVLSGLVGVVYSIVCIIYFIIFVQSVSKKFQGVNLISEISDEAMEVIKKEIKQRVDTPEYIPKEDHTSTKIYSTSNGYLSAINYDKIIRVFEDGEAFNIKVRLGDYVMEDTLIGNAFYQKDQLKETEIEDIQSSFILTDRKVSKIDYRYNITKIYEIAARALSPSVNDPNTAIHCIYKIGVLLSPLSKIDQYNIQSKVYQGAMIYYTSYRFEEDLNRYFIPLINYAQSDVMVIKAIINSLNILKAMATEKNINYIDRIFDYLVQKSEHSFTSDLEKKIIASAFDEDYSERIREYNQIV